jgi:hypothetical protein
LWSREWLERAARMTGAGGTATTGTDSTEADSTGAADATRAVDSTGEVDSTAGAGSTTVTGSTVTLGTTGTIGPADFAAAVERRRAFDFSAANSAEISATTSAGFAALDRDCRTRFGLAAGIAYGSDGSTW